MDYAELAVELLDKMNALRRAKPPKNMGEALQGEAFMLQYIASQGENEDVLPGEIGKEMNVSSARVAQALNNIEKKGWITRQIDQNDRRRILVKLTPEGSKRAAMHQRTAIERTSRMLSFLGEHDAKEYVRIMARLAEMLPDCARSI